MKIYFSGHVGFGNRGNEALVRGTVRAIRERFPEAEFIVPAVNSRADANQWPEASTHGVAFGHLETRVPRLIWWSRVYERIWSGLVNLGRPRAKLDSQTLSEIASCDAVVLSGGDVLSLDHYVLYSLYWHCAVIDAALAMGKPVHVWAASIGPFSAQPAVEVQMIELLRQVSSISVRESQTQAYLRTLGIDSTLVGDQAFLLEPQQYDIAPLQLAKNYDLLGFNISPLVRATLADKTAKSAFDNGIREFLSDCIERRGLSILLTPHVGPLTGRPDGNSDYDYMMELIRGGDFSSGRIALLPSNLNAAQLKSAIGQCRYFIGARTHATIAAWSQGVPTGSISYSVKARGLNHDIFGTEAYVLPSREVSSARLGLLFDKLEADEDIIRRQLAVKLDTIKASARLATDPLGRAQAA